MNFGSRYHLKVILSYHESRLIQQRWVRRQNVLCQEMSYAFELSEAESWVQALKNIRLSLYQSYELWVDLDFCNVMTVMIDSRWQGLENTLLFIEEVRAEVAHEIDQIDDYFLDARAHHLSPEGLEVEVICISRTKMDIYFKHFQAKHLRLKAIYVAGAPYQNINLFPWRQLNKQHFKRAIFLRVSLLPSLVLLGCLLVLFYKNNALDHQQKTFTRLQKQETKLVGLNPDSFTIGDVVPLMGQMNEINHFEMEKEGGLEISGFSPLSSNVSAQMQRFGEQPSLEKNSLHDLKIQQENGRIFWQAAFQIKKGGL